MVLTGEDDDDGLDDDRQCRHDDDNDDDDDNNDEYEYLDAMGYADDWCTVAAADVDKYEARIFKIDLDFGTSSAGAEESLIHEHQTWRASQHIIRRSWVRG